MPFDRRVWQEALALREAGYDVVVVCPQGEERHREAFESLEGVAIHRFPLVFATGGAPSYAREYAAALWKIWRLSRKLAGERPFDFVHVANPPDLLGFAVWPLKLRGARLIYDQHDLVPELYLSRFGDRGLLYHISRWLERASYAIADVVVATNESYREVAVARGRKASEDVFVVRSGPDFSRLRLVEPDESLKQGRRYLLSYIGVMGPQDGIDHALRALAQLRLRRDDWHAILIGEGDVWLEMKALTADLGLDDVVEFTGRIPDEDVIRILSTSDVCLAPDPKNPLNDVSTMNKIVEYMAMSRPLVSYDLKEARVSAGESAIYARANDESSFADCIDQLLDDPERRKRMGMIGRRRIEDSLSWEHSKHELLAAYTRADQA